MLWHCWLGHLIHKIVLQCVDWQVKSHYTISAVDFGPKVTEITEACMISIIDLNLTRSATQRLGQSTTLRCNAFYSTISMLARRLNSYYTALKPTSTGWRSQTNKYLKFLDWLLAVFCTSKHVSNLTDRSNGGHSWRAPIGRRDMLTLGCHITATARCQEIPKRTNFRHISSACMNEYLIAAT